VIMDSGLGADAAPRNDSNDWGEEARGGNSWRRF
jgi:hypothetical protein